MQMHVNLKKNRLGFNINIFVNITNHICVGMLQNNIPMYLYKSQ